jgi:hypothetical protein
MSPLFLPLADDPGEERPESAALKKRRPRAAPPSEASDGGSHAEQASTADAAPTAAARREAPVPDPLSEPFRPALLAQAMSARETRLVFVTLRTETGRLGQSRLQVELDWCGAVYTGDFVKTDDSATRVEPFALATLAAVEAVCRGASASSGAQPTPGLEGVTIVEALGRRYVLTSLQAGTRPRVTNLSGLAVIDRSIGESVVLATLRAADRWVRGRLGESAES